MARSDAPEAQHDIHVAHERSEATWPILTPRFHAQRWPWRQLIGYLASILLTLAAYLMVLDHLIPTTALIVVILCLAAVQAVVQLGFFMHLRESVGPAWHLLALSLGSAVAIGIVGFSVWIVTFHWGAS